MPYHVPVEYAHQRKIRSRNKTYYRVAHWPIWIWVFFLAPGPLTFNLFAHGPDRRNGLWLLLVLIGTGIAGLFGQLPGVEPKPYILKFCEDRPNPMYRRVCYTFAWNALLSFALLNWAGLAEAGVTGVWRLKQIYWSGYGFVFAVVLLLGVLGLLPRAGRSTKGEGTERRYFYAAVWAVTSAQTMLLVVWKLLPPSHLADKVKLAVYTLILAAVAAIALLGRLPRTRPILPGEIMVAD